MILGMKDGREERRKEEGKERRNCIFYDKLKVYFFFRLCNNIRLSLLRFIKVIYI